MASLSYNRFQRPNDDWLVLLSFVLILLFLLCGKCCTTTAKGNTIIESQPYVLISPDSDDCVTYCFTKDSVYIDGKYEGAGYVCHINKEQCTFTIINTDIVYENYSDVWVYHYQMLDDKCVKCDLIIHYSVQTPYEIEYGDEIDSFVMEPLYIPEDKVEHTSFFVQ